MTIVQDHLHMPDEFPLLIKHQMLRRQENDAEIFHWHTYCEISYVKKGQGRYFVNGKEYTLHEGDLIIFNNVEVHGWKLHSEIMELIVLVFTPELIRSINDPFSKEYMQPFLDHGTRFRSKLGCGEICVDEITSLILEIDEEFRNEKKGYHLIIRAKLMNILALLIRHYQDEEIPSDLPDAGEREKLLQRMENTLFYINSHYTEDITLEKAASLACMSPHYFSTCFKASIGIGFREYLIRLRLENAVSLRRMGKMNMTQIAQACGFRNMSNFYRLWNKYIDQNELSHHSDTERR